MKHQHFAKSTLTELKDAKKLHTFVYFWAKKAHQILEAAEVAWPFNIEVSSPSLLKSPGSCSSHVVNTSSPESAHPPVLLPWHFQENSSRLEACRINSRERVGRRRRRLCWPDWLYQRVILWLQMHTPTQTRSKMSAASSSEPNWRLLHLCLSDIKTLAVYFQIIAFFFPSAHKQCQLIPQPLITQQAHNNRGW